jgi:hypothetical protein
VNNWKVIFATVVIFGTGVLTGGLLVNYVQHCSTKAAKAKTTEAKPVDPKAQTTGTNAPPKSTDNSAKPRPPEILNKAFLQRLSEDLQLTSDQREAIQKIMNEGQNQIRKAMQDARLEIRDVLTPDQQKQFDELVKRPFKRPVFGTNGTATVASPTNSQVVSTNAP